MTTYREFKRKEIGSSKVSETLPLLTLIAKEYSLDIKRVVDFNIAKRILINSVERN